MAINIDIYCSCNAALHCLPRNQDCALAESKFSSGNTCEPSGWVESKRQVQLTVGISNAQTAGHASRTVAVPGVISVRSYSSSPLHHPL